MDDSIHARNRTVSSNGIRGDEQMKVKVMKKFRDKHSGEYHKKDKILMISKERYEEICKVDKSLVEEVKAKAKNTAE